MTETKPAITTWKAKHETLELIGAGQDKFSDGKAADLQKWFNDFSYLLHEMDIPRQEGLSLIPFLLKNPALGKYRHLTTEEKADWERKTNAMVTLNQCDLDKEIATQQLTFIEQGKDGISKFAEKIKTLREYAYDDIEEAGRERLMVTKFLNGASRELRTEIRRLKPIPKTMKEMVAQAKRIERILEIEATEEEEEEMVAAVRYQFPEYQANRGGFQGFSRGFSHGRGGYGGYNRGYGRGPYGWQNQGFQSNQRFYGNPGVRGFQGNQGFHGNQRFYGDQGFQGNQGPSGNQGAWRKKKHYTKRIWKKKPLGYGLTSF